MKNKKIGKKKNRRGMNAEDFASAQGGVGIPLYRILYL